jgi:hypothetical protein
MASNALQNLIEELKKAQASVERLSFLAREALIESGDWSEEENELVLTGITNLEVRVQGIAYEAGMRLRIEPLPESNID